MALMVGGFPGLNELNKRTVPGAKNPLDKSTVVSIYPKELNETKHTIFPGTFHVEAGNYEHPALLVVETSSWWKDVGEDQPLLEIPQSSVQVADSIINDYCNGILACDMNEARPGLYFIPGEITLPEVKTKYKPLLERAKTRQFNWYKALVKLADAYWSRTNGNPLAISDDMRMAAREMGLTKAWLADFQTIETVRCIACGAMRNPAFPVCPTCNMVVDIEMAKKLGIRFKE